MAGSDLDIDSVVNALLKEYGYSEPGPRANAAGAGAAAVGKKEQADPGVLSRIAEKMATADKRKEVYCEVCGLVKVKSNSVGVPVCERCYKRVSVLREGRKEAVEFYSDPRNTQRSSRRVKKYIQDAIDAARSRDLELRTEDIPARPAPAAPAAMDAAPSAEKPAPPVKATPPVTPPAAPPAPTPVPAKAETPARPEERPAPPAPPAEKPAAPAAPRAGRLSAAALLEQMDSAPAAVPDTPAEEDDPLVAELAAQLAKTGASAPVPAEKPAPARRKKRQAERTDARTARQPAPAPAAEEPEPPAAAAPAEETPPEEALPTLEEIMAQVREEMPEVPAPPSPRPSPRSARRPAAAAPAPAGTEHIPTEPARPARPAGGPAPARKPRSLGEERYPSLEEMLTPIGTLPPETAAERAAQPPAGRSRRKKQPAPPPAERTPDTPAYGEAYTRPPAAEERRSRRNRQPVPAPAEEIPDPAPAGETEIKAPAPRRRNDAPAAETPRSGVRMEERPPAHGAAEAPVGRAGRRPAKTAAPVPAAPELPETPPEPPKPPRREPSIEEILNRTEEVLGSLGEETPPADGGDVPRRAETGAEPAAHTRSERHLAGRAPRVDERAARKANRPAFALNRPCEACGADEWVGIDGAYSYIELCNNCEKRKVEFNKQEYVDNFECPNCGGLTGTREENKRKFGVRCANCGELTICFRKVDELLMDEKLTAALTDYAKALVTDQGEPVTCPQCGSDSVTSSGTGLFGNRTVNRCARCGYAWKPKWK